MVPTDECFVSHVHTDPLKNNYGVGMSLLKQCNNQGMKWFGNGLGSALTVILFSFLVAGALLPFSFPSCLERREQAVWC